METRRPLLAAVLAVAAAPGACRPAAPAAAHAPAPIPDAVLDEAPWERAFDPAELDAWREGTVAALGSDGELENAPRLAGVRVELFAARPDGHPPLRPVAETVSDAQGRFRVGPGPAMGWMLRASLPGRPPMVGGRGVFVRGAVDLPVDNDVRLAIRAPHAVKGVVRDPAGGPLAGVRLVATSVAYREEAVSGADGAFALCAPAAPVAVEVDDPRFDVVVADVLVPDDGPAPAVALTTRSAEPARGFVVSADDGRPIAGAVVLAPEEPSVRTRTDAQGRFELRVRRNRAVAAFADGFAWRSHPLPEAGELELRLGRAVVVTGRATTSDGRPLSDLRMRAAFLGRHTRVEGVLGPRTAADGTYRFSWVPLAPPGKSLATALVGTARGVFAVAGTLAGARPGDERRVDVATVPGRDVEGTVRHARGGVIAGAVVRATWFPSIEPEQLAVVPTHDRTYAVTDAEGRFRLRGVPGACDAKVRCEHGGVARELALSELRPGEPAEFRFEEGRPISGRVVTAAGEAPEGPVRVTVLLVNAPGVEVRRTVAAAADGSFRVDDLPPGDYQLRAESDRYDLPGGAVVAAGRDDAQLRLERSATLVLRFAAPEGGAPAAPLTVRLWQPDGGGQEYREVVPPARVAEGLTFHGIYPGAWRLSVAGDVWRGGVERLEFGDGERRTLDVALARTLRLRARLLDSGGRPVPGTLVVASPAQPGGEPQTAATAADGALDLTGLSPGRWVLDVAARGLPPFRREVDVTGDGAAPLELRLAPAGTIVVAVRRDDGSALPGALVALFDLEGRPLDAWPQGGAALSSRFRVDEEGRVRIEGVRAGGVRVEVRAGAALLAVRDVLVDAGRETVVEAP